MSDEIRQTKIFSLAYGGSGVGRYEGKIVFVPLAAPGDTVRFRPVKEKKGYIEAEPTEWVESSALRREPPCPVFGECGGCSWQHLPYGEQLSAKDAIFRETLWRLGTVEKKVIEDIIPSPAEWHYRNRAQFKVKYIDGRLNLGFYRRRSHFVIDIDNCPLMSQTINKVLAVLKPVLARAPFREVMPQVDLAANDSDDKAVVTIHLTAPPSHEDISYAGKALEGTQNLAGLFFQSGGKFKLREVFSDKGGLLDYAVSVEGRSINLKFSPGCFTQVNYALNRKLISIASNLAKSLGAKNILDLYCGIGNFTIPLSMVSESATGIEDFEPAIRDGVKNAREAGSRSCRLISGDALNSLNKLDLKTFDTALIDPPRQGAAAVVKKLVESGVQNLIYISCNPSTLARDLRIMTRKGYRIVASRPLDLFPQTYHIESITMASKKR